MNYYYDIILNWSDTQTYDFYEWNDTDCFELIKKIPLIRVKHKTLVDLIESTIKASEEFLLLIKDKTLINGKNIINKISYSCLFTDNKNVIAIEFNENGLSINKSKLLLDDELNVLEVTYGLKEYSLDYEIISTNNNENILRQEKEAKKIVELEINELYERQDLAKLKYLYYEYKQETSDDLTLIYKNIKDDLKKSFNPNILKLYYIIKLSYHSV